MKTIPKANGSPLSVITICKEGRRLGSSKRSDKPKTTKEWDIGKDEIAATAAAVVAAAFPRTADSHSMNDEPIPEPSPQAVSSSPHSSSLSLLSMISDIAEGKFEDQANDDDSSDESTPDSSSPPHSCFDAWGLVDSLPRTHNESFLWQHELPELEDEKADGAHDDHEKAAACVSELLSVLGVADQEMHLEQVQAVQTVIVEDEDDEDEDDGSIFLRRTDKDPVVAAIAPSPTCLDDLPPPPLYSVPSTTTTSAVPLSPVLSQHPSTATATTIPHHHHESFADSWRRRTSGSPTPGGRALFLNGSSAYGPVPNSPVYGGDPAQGRRSTVSQSWSVGCSSSPTSSSPVVATSTTTTTANAAYRRRSLFDLALYHPTEPADHHDAAASPSYPRRASTSSFGSGYGRSATCTSNGQPRGVGMKKANSAGSMEGFYPRPEPRKSSLMKRNTSASSMLLDSTDLSTKSGLSSANATTNNGVGNGTTGASGGGGSGLKRNSSSTVSFSKLEIREYDICLSTHPDCSIGPPIQLGWNYGETKAVSVDEYELLHCDRNRRTGRELLLTSPERRDLLLKEGGYTKQELQWAWQEVERVKLERAAANASSMHMRGRSTSPKARHHRQRHLNSSRSSNNNSGSNNVGDWVGQLLNWIR